MRDLEKKLRDLQDSNAILRTRLVRTGQDTRWGGVGAELHVDENDVS